MNMTLVNNSEKYYDFIRILRTHEENISGFLNQNLITPEEQIKYMNKFGSCYYVCLIEENPVGFVGVVDNDIRVAVDPNFKQRGVGKFMINEIIKKYPEAIAKIKIENLASINLFKSCGFVPKFMVMTHES